VAGVVATERESYDGSYLASEALAGSGYEEEYEEEYEGVEDFSADS